MAKQTISQQSNLRHKIAMNQLQRSWPADFLVLDGGIWRKHHHTHSLREGSPRQCLIVDSISSTIRYIIGIGTNAQALCAIHPEGQKRLLLLIALSSTSFASHTESREMCASFSLSVNVHPSQHCLTYPLTKSKTLYASTHSTIVTKCALYVPLSRDVA